MRWVYKVSCLLLMAVSLYGNQDYILCIDGGGSKTILQVIDQDGQVIHLIRDGKSCNRVETGGSNINNVGVEGVRAAFHSLFENVTVGEEQKELIELIPHSCIVAGMAGAALPKNKQAITSLLGEWGLKPESITVLTDADVALQLIEGDGMILIAGTGSICLGKKDQALFRVGGLGRILGDEGSGYQIGLQALRAALAEAYGWGTPTSLTPALKELFDIPDLKILVAKVNLGEISPSKIASITPLVFDKAEEKDGVAEGIINCAAKNLSDLLATMLKNSRLSHCELHLWGGVFKSAYADAFIQKILEQLPGDRENLTIINRSRYNAATLFASKYLLPQQKGNACAHQK
jgi:N-acetylglucosamine kinase-like BadF-type ATPase